VALAATLPIVQILPVGGLTLLLGADRFMSEIRAASPQQYRGYTGGEIGGRAPSISPWRSRRKGGRTLAADAVPADAVPEFAE
jgi:hypothetical protein